MTGIHLADEREGSLARFCAPRKEVFFVVVDFTANAHARSHCRLVRCPVEETVATTTI